MPRLVTKTAKLPQMVGDAEICMCGLSKDQPFCDKTHKTINEAEDKLYWYHDGVAEEVVTEEDGCSGQCGEGGCGHCHEE